nr:unnamed protein product [Callosobruchus chinensis]
MGGVDSHNNGIANYYRYRVFGKKWWWPLFSTSLDKAAVSPTILVLNKEVPLENSSLPDGLRIIREIMDESSAFNAN